MPSASPFHMPAVSRKTRAASGVSGVRDNKKSTKSATSCWCSSGNRFSFSVRSLFCIAVHRSRRILQIMRAITACIKLSERAVASAALDRDEGGTRRLDTAGLKLIRMPSTMRECQQYQARLVARFHEIESDKRRSRSGVTVLRKPRRVNIRKATKGSKENRKLGLQSGCLGSQSACQAWHFLLIRTG